jgi:hypothetical protein
MDVAMSQSFRRKDPSWKKRGWIQKWRHERREAPDLWPSL